MVYSLHEIQQKLKRNTPLLYDELLRPQTNEKKKKKKSYYTRYPICTKPVLSHMMTEFPSIIVRSKHQSF